MSEVRLSLKAQMAPAKPNELAAVVREIATWEKVDDLDRDALYRIASQLETFQMTVDRATRLVGAVAAAHGLTERMFTGEVTIPVTYVDTTLVEDEDDSAV